MSFRVMIDTSSALAVRAGVAIEVDPHGYRFPLVLSAMRPESATTLRLSVDEGRQLFDALAEALALVTATAGAMHAAGVDTPEADDPSAVRPV